MTPLEFARYVVVSIPQWCDCCKQVCTHFRIKQHWFQSHNGAIAAVNDAINESNRKSFNPTMVRLLPSRSSRGLGSILVSIPQWCDCCVAKTQVHAGKGSVSIPQWCDCCQFSVLKGSSDAFRFNPTMVRLLLPRAIQKAINDLLGFNPTMVRLLRDDYTEAAFVFRFQSHNGAIAATTTSPCGSEPVGFQSHNGAIAALSSPRPTKINPSFQSHNGAIAA